MQTEKGNIKPGTKFSDLSWIRLVSFVSTELSIQ
jgi:hypothetical protein